MQTFIKILLILGILLVLIFIVSLSLSIYYDSVPIYKISLISGIISFIPLFFWLFLDLKYTK